MVTHQTGFPIAMPHRVHQKHFSCSCDAEKRRPQENALTGLYLDKPRHAQLCLQVKSFSPKAPEIRCRRASEQFKKKSTRVLDARVSGERLGMASSGQQRVGWGVM
jgi:hypothetical protein